MWMAEITKPAREDPSGSNYLSGADASLEFVPVLQAASVSRPAYTSSHRD